MENKGYPPAGRWRRAVPGLTRKQRKKRRRQQRSPTRSAAGARRPSRRRRCPRARRKRVGWVGPRRRQWQRGKRSQCRLRGGVLCFVREATPPGEATAGGRRVRRRGGVVGGGRTLGRTSTRRMPAPCGRQRRRGPRLSSAPAPMATAARHGEWGMCPPGWRLASAARRQRRCNGDSIGVGGQPHIVHGLFGIRNGPGVVTHGRGEGGEWGKGQREKPKRGGTKPMFVFGGAAEARGVSRRNARIVR